VPNTISSQPNTVQVGCHLYNNTFILGKSATQWGRPVTADEASFTYSDCYFRDSILLHYKSRKWELGGYVLSRYNLLWPGADTAQFTVAHYKHKSIGGTATIWDDTIYDTRPTTAVLGTDPLLGATPATLFHLTASSPCRAAGSTGGDLGAIPYGESWSMPAVGIGAAAAAYRPALPASIASAATYWMGL
jgi:hypothetical protein